MKVILILLTTFSFCIPAIAQKQSKLLTGMVVSETDHRPIEGALVWVKGTKNYSGTQPDGVYFVEVKPTDTSLVFSYGDLEPQEVKLVGETEYNVVLRRSNLPQNYPKRVAHKSSSTKFTSR